MRRILLLVAGLVGVAALVVAFLPLAWVTERYVPGLESDSVSGSIWDGRIRGARYQGYRVGDVDAGLALGPLLRGEAEIGFRRLGEPLAGRVGLSQGQRRLSDLDGTVTLAAPVGGLEVVLGLDGVDLETDARGRCRAVSGTVTATLARVPVLGELPPLIGEPRCDGDSVHLPLAIADGSVGLDLMLEPSGRWQADLKVRAHSELMAGLLEMAGFVRTADGVLLRFEGRAG